MSRFHCFVIACLLGTAFTALQVGLYDFAQTTGLIQYEYGRIASLEAGPGYTINIYAESHDDPGQPLLYEILRGGQLVMPETYLRNYEGSSRSLNLTLIQPPGLDTVGLVKASAPTQLLELFLLDNVPHALGCDSEEERAKYCEFTAATGCAYVHESRCECPSSDAAVAELGLPDAP